MNYILQLRAFKKQRLIKPLTSSAVLLYFILLEFCNDIGFPKSFTLTNSALAVYSGLSMQSVIRGRSQLAEYGYITYIPGTGVQCGTYSLTNLTVNYDTPRDHPSDIQPLSDTPDDTPSGNPHDTLFDKQVVSTAITLTKQNLNKTNKTKMTQTCPSEKRTCFYSTTSGRPIRKNRLSPKRSRHFKSCLRIKNCRTECLKPSGCFPGRTAGSITTAVHTASGDMAQRQALGG